ncbi:MAG TPA: LysM peptidoglycan-binding domain-containing protein [Verrucomicrobiae bacterium]|nr:LysM peptidoglycan-binding domain-containing protein [Verrucomicrobiae bacterium]
MQRVTSSVVLLLAGVVMMHGQANAPLTDVVTPTPVRPAAPQEPVTIQMAITVPTNPPPAPAESAPSAAAQTPAAPGVTGDLTDYTVKSGDSLWKIGKRFGVPVDVILQVNGMKSDRLSIGQVLKIPPKQPKVAPGAPAPSSSPAAAPLGPGQYMVRQGDTLWDIARAHDVSVQEIRQANKLKSNALQIGQILTIPPRAQAPAAPSAPGGRPAIIPPSVPSPLVAPPPPTETPPTTPQPAPKTPSPGAQRDNGPGRAATIAAAFSRETDSLAARRIRYAQRWRPPGEPQAWVMDCSNTSRYLYRRVAGIDIGRTASDQYYFLSQRRLAWRIPPDLEGDALTAYLAERMRPGDLLFWEHTYKPKRNPPVTHVMVYLGRTRDGNLLMAGSQSHGTGRDGRTEGGPDVYLFDPEAPAGGYSTWLGFGHIKGRFVGYGRPLGLSET